MTGVAGIGWWTDEAWGSVITGARGTGGGQERFSTQFRNFGRLDRDSKAAAYAVALALEDAGMSYPLTPESTAGIAGGSTLGCLSADLAYFRDYVECGRTLGRGNYFIYTLPTSPIAECAIHFGLEGPVLYAAGGSISCVSPMGIALRAMDDGQADLMLSGCIFQDGALFLVLSPEGKAGGRGGSIRPDEIMDVLARNEQSASSVADVAGLLDNLMKERGKRAAV